MILVHMFATFWRYELLNLCSAVRRKSVPTTDMFPCRQCPHVVVVVDLVCVSDPWGYAVEPLMPERSKVRRQTKRDMGVYATRRWWRFASGTRLFIRRACASEPGMA